MKIEPTESFFLPLKGSFIALGASPFETDR